MGVFQYLVGFLVHCTVAQFPVHLDVQKVGEIIYNNEKYNVLRPTVHKITDHFQDFMLRRENKHPNEKVFIDDNGFRHFWSGLGLKDDSLRKTEITKNTKQEDATGDVKNETGMKNDEADDSKTSAVVETTSIASKTPEEALRQAQAKKIARAYFFCPFFGVIEMTSVID